MKKSYVALTQNSRVGIIVSQKFMILWSEPNIEKYALRSEISSVPCFCDYTVIIGDCAACEEVNTP